MKTITSHSNYSADDYSYLRAKGWSNAEIIGRWDEEAAAGQVACQWTGYFARTKLKGVIS